MPRQGRACEGYRPKVADIINQMTDPGLQVTLAEIDCEWSFPFNWENVAPYKATLIKHQTTAEKGDRVSNDLSDHTPQHHLTHLDSK
jgi:hypothetical protein